MFPEWPRLLFGMGGFTVTSAAARKMRRHRPCQEAHPGRDPPDTGDQPDTIGRRSHAIPSRMARILWLLPDPTSAHQPGGMDPPKATVVSLAAMAERAQPFPGTAAPWRAEVPGGGCRRLADRVLAHVRTSGGPTGPAQPVFRRPRSSPPLSFCSSLIRSNRRGTDPYARWCGRGDAARRPLSPSLPLKRPFQQYCRLTDLGGERRPRNLLIASRRFVG
jgi:hypothetical protein